MRAKSGLIVEVTEGDSFGAGGNPVKQVVKLALKGNALAMATELHPHGVAAVSITPGFLRSESMLEHFGANLRRERRSREISQRRLAQKAGVSPQYVGLIERGYQPRLAIVDRLARALGTPVAALVQPHPEAETGDAAR